MLKKVYAFLCAFLVCLTPISVQAESILEEEDQVEFRGVWIATVGNTNWPSKRGLSEAEQKKEFVKLLDGAAALNLNAVVVQVRPTCDTFYPSDLNPWSEYLTGVQGKDPGYDPLAFMVDQAHERGMEFHAWFNPFRVTTGTQPKTWAENSVYKQHPDWVVKYNGMRWLDPGIPEVRDYAVRSVLEVVEKYDIDAVHFDDYFYPYPEGGKSFPDNATFQKYGGDLSKENWRRANINEFISSVSTRIKETKSQVKFGVSPIGVWRSANKDPDGSDTTALGSYDSVFADTRLWMRNSWVDYIVPQIYWEVGYAKASYDKVLDFWVTEAEANPNVHLYIGQALYKVNAWSDPEEMIRQLQMNRDRQLVKGSVFFSISSLLANPQSISQAIISRFYQNPVPVPVMPWLEAQKEEDSVAP